MALMRLPNELLIRIAELAEVEDLVALHATSRRFHIATQYHFLSTFFSTIVFAHSISGLRKLNDILSYPHLRHYIQKIVAVGTNQRKDEAENGLAAAAIDELKRLNIHVDFVVRYSDCYWLDKETGISSWGSANNLYQFARRIFAMPESLDPSFRSVAIEVETQLAAVQRNGLGKPSLLPDWSAHVQANIINTLRLFLTTHRNQQIQIRLFDNGFRSPPTSKISYHHALRQVEFDHTTIYDCVALSTWFKAKEISLQNCDFVFDCFYEMVRAKNFSLQRLMLKNVRFYHDQYARPRVNLKSILMACWNLECCHIQNVRHVKQNFLKQDEPGPAFVGVFEATGVKNVWDGLQTLDFNRI